MLLAQFSAFPFLVPPFISEFVQTCNSGNYHCFAKFPMLTCIYWFAYLLTYRYILDILICWYRYILTYWFIEINMHICYHIVYLYTYWHIDIHMNIHKLTHWYWYIILIYQYIWYTWCCIDQHTNILIYTHAGMLRMI